MNISVCLYVCVPAVGYVCGVGNKTTFLNLISYLNLKDSTDASKYSELQGSEKNSNEKHLLISSITEIQDFLTLSDLHQQLI